MILGLAAAPAGADPSEERCRPESERKPCCQPAVGDWREFVELEVRDEELVLTNVSDRPIVAWSVRKVTRITEGNEGWGGLTKDALGYALEPDGYESLFLPGETVTLDRPGEPWIRPDLKGPEYLVYYDVGALVFENAEWVGVPEVVDRIFEYRLEVARDALTALEMIDSANPDIDRLPKRYQHILRQFASRADGLRAILGEARESYQNAVANLRPEDLASLQLMDDVP
jgi:hypothetical protein